MNIVYLLVFVFCCSGQWSYGKLCGEDCCAFYFKSDGACKECPTGTVRLSEDAEDHCKPCQRGFYGYRCVNMCKCSKHESCDPFRGCLSKGDDVDSQQVYSDTNRRSLQSTTNVMNLKNEKHTAATFFYKDILVITLSCVVISVVIAMITKRAHHHCKRFEVSSVVENSNAMHVEAIEAGLDNDITESENKTDFSSKDSWSSFDSIVSESDGRLPVETEPVIIQSCYSIADIYHN